jgi:hypothetical protein
MRRSHAASSCPVRFQTSVPTGVLAVSHLIGGKHYMACDQARAAAVVLQCFAIETRA